MHDVQEKLTAILTPWYANRRQFLWHAVQKKNAGDPHMAMCKSPAVPAPPKYGIGAALKKAAAATGASEVTLRRAHEHAAAIGGREALKELAGTSLGLQAEVTSLARLRKEAPELASGILAKAKAGLNVSARAELGALVKVKRLKRRMDGVRRQEWRKSISIGIGWRRRYR